jgi:superfamily I DNA and/or RNA helicase
MDRLGLDDKVLTIDQCQGQEADFVIFSLVQRPTRFLNTNRSNVALSRTRGKLVILGDKNEFRRAADNASWDCAKIAQDLLAASA